MRIKDEALLAEFRAGRRCEWCGRPALSCQVHHVFARGMGSASRLDVRINLMALCCHCHAEAHSGQITRSDLLALVAAREGLLQADVLAELYRLRRLPKGSVP